MPKWTLVSLITSLLVESIEGLVIGKELILEIPSNIVSSVYHCYANFSFTYFSTLKMKINKFARIMLLKFWRPHLGSMPNFVPKCGPFSIHW